MSQDDIVTTSSCYYLIVNPHSGTRNFRKSWSQIQQLLTDRNVDFSFAFTQHSKDEIQLVDTAVKQGFRKIISVGGDGTLHHVVNGILRQRYTKSSEIKLGVIPLGTGNDWIKTYEIPLSIEKSIDILLKDHTIFQDVGVLQHSDGTTEYFNNIAGVGYDGYVVKKLNSLKKLGSIAYLISGLQGLLFYKKSTYTIKVQYETIEEKCLMILFGICQYSGGGMQMTKNAQPNDGLLDITIAKNFSFFDLIFNLPKLYNGDIVNHKKVATYKADSIEIQPNNATNAIIEADGELIGTGGLNVSILPTAIQILVKS